MISQDDVHPTHSASPELVFTTTVTFNVIFKPVCSEPSLLRNLTLREVLLFLNCCVVSKECNDSYYHASKMTFSPKNKGNG